MRVGFLLAGNDPTGYVCADALLASVRTAMPGTEVVQLTDEVSPAVVGIDAVRRRPPAPLMVLQVDHFAACDGDWLLIDTDTLVQRDVRDVFADRVFDVAVATREGTYVAAERESEFMRAMPYNLGVVYSRSPSFWRSVLETLLAMPAPQQQWMGSQRAGNAVIAAGAYAVAVLGREYNYPPQAPDEDVSAVAVVHYKGRVRKKWLLERLYRETVCASA